MADQGDRDCLLQFLCQRLFPQKVFFGWSESTAQKPCVHSCRDAEQKSRFINEPIYTDALETQAKILLKNYAIGHLLVPGDNRFLSGDLLELLRQLMSPRVFQMPAERVFCDAVTADFFA